MDRNEALVLVKQNVENRNLIKHMLACEACMRKLAGHFNEDADKWGLAGILHDLDYPQTVDNPEKHAYITVEMLKEHGVEQEILDAILAHPGHKKREKPIEQALYAIDPLTGLIVAAVLMHPDRKIAGIDTEFIMRRYKEKRFAAGASREQIAAIEETGISLEEFVGMCIEAMKSISKELGL